jgi:hypothetical protein
VFNATLNEEEGYYRLDKAQYLTAKQFRLNLSKIRQILFRKHPLLKQLYRSGTGLELQFVDSQIAEKVMLSLMERSIPCMPVHDSFLVPRHQVSELTSTMKSAFEAVTGHSPALKDVEPFASDFRLPFKADGSVDHQAMFSMHSSALHDNFVQSRRAEQTRQTGTEERVLESTHNVKKFFTIFRKKQKKS